MFTTDPRHRTRLHKTDDGGGSWWMRLEPISTFLLESYIAISISSRHQIRFAAQELNCFSKRGWGLFFSFFFLFVSSWTISSPHQRSEGESVAFPMQNGDWSFFSTKRSSRSFTILPLGSFHRYQLETSCLDEVFFFFLQWNHGRRGKEGRKEGRIYISTKSIRDEVQCGLRYNRHRVRDNATMSTVSEPVR